MNSLLDCGQTEKVCEVSPVTIEEKLERKKLQLERELTDVNAALDGVKQNPEVVKLFNLLTKASRGY